jgi:pimeloyl-ACP methyl ester carboxylesterase
MHTMNTYRVTSSDGTALHVQETGNPAGRPVLFIHGYSQSRLAWNKQLHSDLARDLRLVALDLRGHGLSDKPRDAYTDSQLWADDVKAVIDALNLEMPILSGWSYGGVVICDYLQYYGDARLGGVQFVASVTRLGEPVMPFLGKRFVDCIPGFFSTDVETSAQALQTFMQICAYGGPKPEDFYFFLGYNTIVPPFVRQGLFSRTLNYDDLLPTLAKEALFVHGVEDEIVLHAMSEANVCLTPRARLSSYPQVGHAPFWEAPARFNAELKDFAASLAK